MFLVFDTETTGLPKNWKAPITDTNNWPRMVQLAWQCHDIEGNFLFAKNHVIKPEGYTIPEEVVNIHGITTEIAHEKGIALKDALLDFMGDVKKSKFIIGHNISFDINVVGCELVRCGMEETLSRAPSLCTMLESKEFCDIRRNGQLQNPGLTALHIKLFTVPFEEAHNAAADVESTTRCFLELVRVGGITPQRLQMTPAQIEAFRLKNPEMIQLVGVEYETFKIDTLDHISIADEEEKLRQAAKSAGKVPFVHLHVHTQYSILDGANKTAVIAKKAKDDGMPALAITDHGSMFGVKEFHVACLRAGIKPIIGIEAYVARRGRLRKDDKTDASGHHLILLAKNETGYINLLKLTSISHMEGFYYKPRIDKEVLQKYSEGLIVSSACLGGEVSQHIMNGNLDKARETIQWFKEVFGDDYYLEVMRHKNDDPVLRRDVWENQVKVNKVILELGKELGVKVIASNDTHFTNAEDAEAHDLLVCLSTGRDFDDPTRMRYTKQEWFKTTQEMNLMFADIPEVLQNTIDVAGKVEAFELDKKPIMPDFPLPPDFDSEADFLRHLTMEGAKKRYGDPIPPDVLERINFELETIIGMGFPGYFLITQDFINWAKDNGVLVGPGRGSAVGAVVAYCTGITNVDPIKYDLLFERFLNPDRISMPDVDIDFDDDGRQAVLDYVTNKYGHDKVAHICTFGTMATKSSIKDVARVLKLDLSEANRLAKMVPEAPKMNFKKAFKDNPDLELEKNSPDPLIAKTMKFAEALEGAVRQTGVHACGVLIGKNPLDQHLPVMPTKGEELMTTQYDGRFVEDIGLLKMDFLGLKTLSIFKEVLGNIKLSKGIDVDLETIPMDDEITLKLFGNGETTAIFQFESPGMKKHLKALQPNRFEDLVAMNALYRPGPMEYIPSFIARKHGREDIAYDHPMMEPFLKDTYGITVYQEQVMLQSRALGNFTRGDSDSLRKAMGKKVIAMMDKLKVKFTDGCLGSEGFMKGCEGKKQKPTDLIDKIWHDWEAFASYAFNKSHSVCYALIAYQTGYLKAHYPAEFMSGVLSRNLNDIAKITTFMEECKRMGMDVLGPDVNESYRKFTVNKSGAIRFGMAGVKGVGAGAVEEIIKVRDEGGPFKDIFDFVERVNLQTVNKKNLEALAAAGGFDGFTALHRAQYFACLQGEQTTFVENLSRYANLFQNDKATAATSLFGSIGASAAINKPIAPYCQEFSLLEKLAREKDLIGIYLSAHPLDMFKLEINHFCTTKLSDLEDLEKMKGRDITVGGMVTASRSGMTKTGKPYGIMSLDDYTGTFEFAFFGNDYPEYARYLVQGYYIMMRAKVQEKAWTKVGELEVKVNKIEMLDGVRESRVTGINIQIPLHALDEALVTDLAELSKETTGNVALKFSIYDKDEDNHQTQFYSRSSKITLTDDMVDYLDAHPDVSFTLF